MSKIDQQIEKDLDILKNEFRSFNNVELWNDNPKSLMYKMNTISGLSHGYLNLLKKHGFKLYNLSLMTSLANNVSFCEILLEKSIKK